MLAQLATIPGRDDRPNEDFPAALPDCALLLDGATRFVDFSLGDWRELLALLGTAGINGVFDRIWAAEAGDPDGARWPRAKRYTTRPSSTSHSTPAATAMPTPI